MEKESSPPTCKNFEDRIKHGSDNGLPIDVILKRMNPQEITEYVLNQYTTLNDQYTELTKHYRAIIDQTRKDNRELTDRIEHILALMTTNMTFMKQLVQITDIATERLNEQERINSKQELGLSDMIARQNRFAQCLENMSKNTSAIVTAMNDLKSKVDEHDKFNSKLAIIITVGTLVIGWIMSGTNFSQLIVTLSKLLDKAQ